MNIGRLMRTYAPGMNISPSAVKEMIRRIECFLEVAMPEIAEISKRNGCKKTIKEYEDLKSPEKSQAHITMYFGMVENNIRVKDINKSNNRRNRK